MRVKAVLEYKPDAPSGFRLRARPTEGEHTRIAWVVSNPYTSTDYPGAEVTIEYDPEDQFCTIVERAPYKRWAPPE